MTTAENDVEDGQTLIDLLKSRFPGFTIAPEEHSPSSVRIEDFPLPGVYATVAGRKIQFWFQNFELLDYEEVAKILRLRVCERAGFLLGRGRKTDREC